MSLIDVHTEWDPLEEIVVGTIAGARVPVTDRSLIAAEYGDIDDPQEVQPGPYPAHVVLGIDAGLLVLSGKLLSWFPVLRYTLPWYLLSYAATQHPEGGIIMLLFAGQSNSTLPPL